MDKTAAHLEELKHVAALRNLPAQALERLAELAVRQTYAPGEFIFLEGDRPAGLWFVIRGRVRITKHSSNGKVIGLCLMNSGKCFGNCPLFEEETNPASAEAVDEVTLLILPRDELQQLVRHDTLLTTSMLQIYSQRLALLARLGEVFGSWSTTDRINNSLLSNADHSQVKPVVSLTQEKLASLAGTVREVVTRHLAQLEREGVVRVETGQVILLDVDALNLPCSTGR